MAKARSHCVNTPFPDRSTTSSVVIRHNSHQHLLELFSSPSAHERMKYTGQICGEGKGEGKLGQVPGCRTAVDSGSVALPMCGSDEAGLVPLCECYREHEFTERLTLCTWKVTAELTLEEEKGLSNSPKSRVAPAPSGSGVCACARTGVHARVQVTPRATPMKNPGCCNRNFLTFCYFDCYMEL